MLDVGRRLRSGGRGLVARPFPSCTFFWTKNGVYFRSLAFVFVFVFVVFVVFSDVQILAVGFVLELVSASLDLHFHQELVHNGIVHVAAGRLGAVRVKRGGALFARVELRLEVLL